MRVKKTTAVDYALFLTLAEAKAWARETGTDKDADISRLIRATYDHIEDVTGRTLLTATWRGTLDAFPANGDPFRLPKSPVASITSIKYIDESGVQQTMNPSAYVLDNASEPEWVFASWGGVWPATRGQPNAVTVEFVAGYGDENADLPTVAITYAAAFINTALENRSMVQAGTIVANFAHFDSMLDYLKLPVI